MQIDMLDHREEITRYAFSMSTSDNHHVLSRLPPEIWIHILRWATLPSDGYPAPYYQPFSPSAESFDECLRTRRALVQVCHLWRTLATVFLYQDVRIRKDGGTLKATLVDVGKYVERLELPFTQTVTERPGDTHDVIEILESCPFLKTLVRPFFRDPDRYHSARHEFPAEIISLPSLTRLEWWYNNNAARSGGINSLAHVLRNAPSLQFLCIGGEFWTNSNSHEESSLRLPSLTTLRLRRANALFVWQVCRWELPSLVHVVVDFPPDENGLELLWSHFGRQLCTVEFGRNIVFHMTDQMAAFIRGCEQVKNFNYFINFTSPPTQSLLEEPSSLQCIGIHAFPCAILHDRWRHLENHFSFLSSRFLPDLKRVVLHGDWQEIVQDRRFVAFQDRLKQIKGTSILFGDQLTGSPCEHL